MAHQNQPPRQPVQVNVPKNATPAEIVDAMERLHDFAKKLAAPQQSGTAAAKKAVSDKLITDTVKELIELQKTIGESLTTRQQQMVGKILEQAKSMADANATQVGALKAEITSLLNDLGTQYESWRDRCNTERDATEAARTQRDNLAREILLARVEIGGHARERDLDRREWAVEHHEHHPVLGFFHSAVEHISGAGVAQTVRAVVIGIVTLIVVSSLFGCSGGAVRKDIIAAVDKAGQRGITRGTQALVRDTLRDRREYELETKTLEARLHVDTALIHRGINPRCANCSAQGQQSAGVRVDWIKVGQDFTITSNGDGPNLVWTKPPREDNVGTFDCDTVAVEWRAVLPQAYVANGTVAGGILMVEGPDGVQSYTTSYRFVENRNSWIIDIRTPGLYKATVTIGGVPYRQITFRSI